LEPDAKRRPRWCQHFDEIANSQRQIAEIERLGDRRREIRAIGTLFN
jgi:hypothetical protein